MSIFVQLLAIKDFRQSKAELATQKQRQVLRLAQEQEQERQRKLEQFREFARAQELKMYQELCQRVVKLREIEDVQLEVVSLGNQTRTHESSLEQAQKERTQADTKLQECKHILNEATRAKQKFVELAQAHAQEVIKELERKEDAEMEEVAELRRERADWDEYHEEEQSA